MRETARVFTIGLLVALSPWLLLAGMLLLLIPGPVQRWGKHLGSASSVGAPTRGAPRCSATDADDAVAASHPRPCRRKRIGTPYVVRWWRALPVAGAIKTLRFAVLLFIVLHVEDMADWEHLRWSADPGPQSGLVQELLSSFVALPTAVLPGTLPRSAESRNFCSGS